MSRALPLLGKLHPLTGEPIRAIGWRPDGSPLWPILGGDPSNDPPERPEDITEEVWDALGDPGKQALVRERQARSEAEQARAQAERERDAARARPAPPKDQQPAQQAGQQPPGQQAQQPDIAAIVKQAVDAAIKPFADAEQQRQTDAAAGRVRDAVVEAAKPLLHDATDALQIDLASVVNDQGAADAEKVKKALETLITAKPHLAKTGTRQAPPGIGGGGPATPTDAEKVKETLARMQKSTGLRSTTAAS